jgi:hypothetical protein
MKTSLQGPLSALFHLALKAMDGNELEPQDGGFRLNMKQTSRGD